MIGLRGPSVRQFVLYLWSWLQGVRVLWLDRDSDAPLAKLVLTQAPLDKGAGVEDILALPAWHPILSVESVSGPRYAILKANFGRLHAHLPSIAELQELTRSMTKQALQELKEANAAAQAPRPFDANDLCRLVVRIFVRWLFGAELSASHFAAEQQDLLVRASWEWRKQIACKGTADPAVKSRTIEWSISILRASRYAAEIFTGSDGGADDVASPLVYSVFLQPFVLSPMINVSDIAVTWFAHPTTTTTTAAMQLTSTQQQHQQSHQQMQQRQTLKQDQHLLQQQRTSGADTSPSSATRLRTHHLLRMISLAHPFPILERFVATPIYDPSDASRVLVRAGTQVFIALDRLDTGGIDAAEAEAELATHSSSSSSNGTRASSNGSSVNGSHHSLPYELAFGAGARSCAGKSIAIGFMLPLFEELDHERATPLLSASPLSIAALSSPVTALSFPPLSSQPLLLQPALHHRYSGRHNDASESEGGSSWGTLWYQMRMLCSITWTILKRGQCCGGGARRREEGRTRRSTQIAPKQA